MKVLVVYDSLYGNTEQIAKSIGSAFPSADIQVIRAAGTSPAALAGIDLLIAGSPTNGGRPTPAMLEFLSRLGDLKGMKVSAFDTRLSGRLVGIFGFAAGRIARALEKSGGALAAPPEGFFVKGREGPLKEGELERAAGWGKSLREKVTAQ